MIAVHTRKMNEIWFGVAYEEETVYSTWFGSDENSTLRGLLKGIPFGASFKQSQKASAFAQRVIAVEKDIYDGKDVSLKFALATKHLPDYTRSVLETVYMIPTGYVSFYRLVSKAVGGGPRAVGNIMAGNPFAPIVPCHRVVRSDFTLGGYGGGLDLKLQILKRERRGYVSKKDIQVNGKKLQLFPVEFAVERVQSRQKLN
jgi:O-6-methylguanine DNA methyltransferase